MPKRLHHALNTRGGLAVVLTLSATALSAWIPIMAHGLHGRVSPRKRRAWIALDLAELACLSVAAAGLSGESFFRPVTRIAAGAAGVLLLLDAVVDTTTAKGDQEIRMAILMAFLAEVPLALVSLRAAARKLHGPHVL